MLFPGLFFKFYFFFHYYYMLFCYVLSFLSSISCILTYLFDFLIIRSWDLFCPGKLFPKFPFHRLFLDPIWCTIACFLDLGNFLIPNFSRPPSNFPRRVVHVHPHQMLKRTYLFSILNAIHSTVFLWSSPFSWHHFHFL